jgi:hypothetical protein
MLEAERERKRQKFIRPRPLAGVVCASKSPILVDALPASVQQTRARLCDFFPEEINLKTAAAEPDDHDDVIISDAVMQAIQDDALLEADLRNAVCHELVHNHGIIFPASSNVCGNNIIRLPRARKTNVKVQKYEETNLKNLFAEFERVQFMLGSGGQDLERIMLGLPVTTTSLPDATQYDGDQMRFGEFKNKDVYTTMHASTQNFLYMIALMYWLRTGLGMKVETVYGFGFCGCKCDGHNGRKYAVGLFKLSLPAKLGGQLKAEYLWKYGEIDDKKPMQLLVEFLKNGHRWNLAAPFHPTIPTSYIPARLMLPSSLWDNTASRELVANGTMAIVFRCSPEAVIDLLTNHVDRKLLDDRSWGKFRKDILNCLNIRWNAIRQVFGGKSNEKFYVKVVNSTTLMRTFSSDPFQRRYDILTSQHPDVRRTYPVRPFCSKSASVIFMRDRGRPVLNTNFSDTSSVCKAFLPILKLADSLSDSVPHGDALPHNFVHDETGRDMHLIDMDECVEVEDLVQRNADDDWLGTLSYPNLLRSFPQEYTRSQLIASYFFLVNRVGPMENAQLESDIMEVGESLRTGGEVNEAINAIFCRIQTAVEHSALS